MISKQLGYMMEDNKGWTDSQRKLAIQELVERDELIPPFKAHYIDDLKDFAIVECGDENSYTVNMKFGNVISSKPEPYKIDYWLARTFFTRIVLTDKGREFAKKVKLVDD